MQRSPTLQEAYAKLRSGFFAFWIINRRVSLLVTLLIILLGWFGLYSIPKESNPEIEIWIITITTVYRGVSPVDMDTLVAQEIEDAISDIEWVESYETRSSVWVSTTSITLDTGADSQDVSTEVRDEVEKAAIPEGAEDPIITTISSDDGVIYGAVLYADENAYPRERLLQVADALADRLESLNAISWATVSFWSGFSGDFGWGQSERGTEFVLEVVVDETITQELGLSLQRIWQSIRAFNANTPLGQFEVDGLNYDFRVAGELSAQEDLLEVPILNDWGRIVTLGDVASVIRTYENDVTQKLWKYEEQGYNALIMNVAKADAANIFDAADDSKALIEEFLSSYQYQGVQVAYQQDLAEIIQEDYDTLATSGVQTLIFVFLCLILFVGIKEAFIATIGIPLAFLVTFFVLDQLWYTLNFLTNFSLVLTLWIAIDTSIVVVEASYERLKLWYKPMTAVLMAVRDFKAPLIAWTSTTIVVFIPMMVLPGITGKFLAYIPITVFITLIAALFIALTVNAAIFFLLSKQKKKYIKEESVEQFLSSTDKLILDEERQGIEQVTSETMSFKQRMLEGLNRGYEKILRSYIYSAPTRRLAVLLPVIAVVLSFVAFAQEIGFTLFPSGDNDFMTVQIEADAGATEQAITPWLPYLQSSLAQYEEIETYIITLSGDSASINLNLFPNKDRQKAEQLNVFELEDEVKELLRPLRQWGLRAETEILSGWPPAWSPVALKLITQDNERFGELIDTALEVQDYFRTIDGLQNIWSSANATPGEFVYTFDTPALSALWLTPNDILGEIAFALSWINAGSVTIDGVDADIELTYQQFVDDEVSPTDILALEVATQRGTITVGEVMNYRIDNAVASISRDDGNITVTVSADLDDSVANQWPVFQQEIIAWAEEQTFPAWVSFVAWGETEENADLIFATGQGMVIAIFLILIILVIQFNSFAKPFTIMYSIMCALLWVNLWLYFTGNPYSMPAAIGFIALVWIVVNDAIVLIDRINENVSHDIMVSEAIIEAWRSRLQPIILTTLTTLLWVLPIALQDEFWEGLGFTLVSGLFAGSAMTLFVIPCLYYMLFVNKAEKQEIKRIRAARS